jgi:cytochrome c peroxidase
MAAEARGAILKRMTRLIALALLAAAVPPAQERRWPRLERYEPMVVAPDNPMSEEKVALGRQLFFDKRLSGDRSRACTSCHRPEAGLTEGGTPTRAAYDMPNGRSCPTLWNAAYQQAYYWEGAGRTLEQAVSGVWKFEMAPGGEGRLGTADVAARLNAIPGYLRQFERVFGAPADPANVPKALAAFVRTLVADRTRWIRFYYGDTKALSEKARRGYAVFDKVGRCTQCHGGQLLTDLQFHNVGIGSQKPKPELGRFVITKDERDRGAFKTPSLLNVGRSAPYFHAGSVATLEEAVEIMAGGGIANPHKDASLEPRRLSAPQKRQILDFLRELDVDYTDPPPQLPEENVRTMTLEITRISQIALVVNDVARAEQFYKDTLGLKHLFGVPGKLSFFDVGGTRIMLSLPEPTVSHKSAILYFDVADIQAAHAELRAKGTPKLGTPHVVGKLGDKEVWIAEFQDPDGNLLALQCIK